jgi:hypothetical protein
MNICKSLWCTLHFHVIIQWWARQLMPAYFLLKRGNKLEASLVLRLHLPNTTNSGRRLSLGLRVLETASCPGIACLAPPFEFFPCSWIEMYIHVHIHVAHDQWYNNNM